MEWDVLVSPWHLEEWIDGFPAPAGAIALTGPPDAGESELRRLADRYRDVADAVAKVDRPLVLAGDCLTSLGLVAGLHRIGDESTRRAITRLAAAIGAELRWSAVRASERG